MTTSGTVDFNMTRNDVIKGALRLVNALASEETPEAAAVSESSDALNMLIKAWMAQEVGLWAHQICTLFVQKDQAAYKLGTATGADHCTASHVETKTTADEIATSTVIEVDSSTGMTAADNVGIIMDNGVVYWDTIASVDSATQITLTTGLTAVTTTGAVVYAYTTKINRPLAIVEARHRNASTSVSGDGTDIPLDMIARNDYMFLSNKTVTGVTTQAFYDPQLNLGVLKLWPVPNSAKETIRLTIQRPLEDVNAAGDDFDFPQEWFRALKFNLAVEIGPEYSLPLDRLGWLERKAEQLLADAIGWDSEQVSFLPMPHEDYG